MRFRTLKQQQKTAPIIEEPKYIYAKYTDRIKALITDMFMIYMPIMFIITYAVLGSKEELQDSEFAPFIAVSLYGLIYAFLISKFGQTPGKKAYDLKIVDDKTGEFIGFFRSLFRFIMFLFTATTILGLFLPLIRKDKKSLHDLICNTLVVTQKK